MSFGRTKWLAVARQFGYLLDGVQHGLNVGLFLGLLLKSSFLVSLLGLIISSVPAVGVVAAVPDLFTPLLIMTIAAPITFVWQDQLFSEAFQQSQGIVGVGAWDYRTLFVSGKLTTVTSDSLTMSIPLFIIWGLRELTKRTELGNYIILIEVIATCVECLVFAFLCHSSRLDRMNIVTRGLKSQFLDRRIPYFCGFSAPSLLIVKWLSKRLLLSDCSGLFIHFIVLAVSTSATAAVRADDMGRPHFTFRILSLSHKIVSILLPSSSGRGYS